LKNGTVYTFPDAFDSSSPRQGAVTSVTDRNGNILTLTRDSNSNLTRITSPNGRYIQLTYDSSNRVIQAQDNTGRVVTYAYDSGGRLSTVTDANGGVTTYTYDSNNNMLTVTDPRSITYLTNQYDSNGRVIKQTLADGSVYQFAYTLDSNGNVTQTNVTDPNGNLEEAVFNPPPSTPDGLATGGMPSSVTYATGGPQQQAFTSQYQSGTDLPASVTDPLGRTTSYTYDSLGNVASITRLAGTSNAVTTSFTYDR
jgi:YD repeat-containing protein